MSKEKNISRRTLREKALQILYAVEQSNNDLEVLFSDLLSNINDNDAIYFIKDLVVKTLDHNGEFDNIIKDYSDNWEMDRIAIIDKIVIRMALCEFIYFPDIPPKVSINEAIEIARRFSTDQSDKFVNGILDSIYRKLVKENKIIKEGRGLIDKSNS